MKDSVRKMLTTTPRPRGEDPRVEDLLQRGVKLRATVDPVRLRTTIDALLKKTGPELYDWAAVSMKAAEEAGNGFVNITRDLTALNVNRWIEETKTASSRTPRPVLDRLAPPPGPAYFRARLDGVRQELIGNVLKRIASTLLDVNAAKSPLELDVIALQALLDSLQSSSENVDVILLSTVSNRVRTLLTAQLSLQQLERSCEDARTSVDRYVTAIDQLSAVINNWSLAQSRS